jgi:tRNA modification GTPase
MLVVNNEDTIAAIATPAGEASIGIVRISGNRAIGAVDGLFRSRRGSSLAAASTHTVHYGWVHNADNGQVIDEALVIVMRAPRSYTREDVVEIQCHGGSQSVQLILDAVLTRGVRFAQPGEFTRRAFLNGRIDLTQAEAVLDIIKAKTELSMRAGLNHLQGRFSSQIRLVRESLVNVLAEVEAHIDFSDEEIGQLRQSRVLAQLEDIQEKLRRFIDDSRVGRFLREGARVVICGCPNVGKSSLLNALLRQERSIVTPIAGTTRDTIEAMVDMRGIPVRLFDTAGILKPRNIIEKKAMRMSARAISLAHVLLAVFDGSRILAPKDMQFARAMQKKGALAVINKSDKRERIDSGVIAKMFGSSIHVCARRGDNIDKLEDAILDRIRGKTKIEDLVVLANLRHVQKLKAALHAVLRAGKSSQDKLSLEFVAEDLRQGCGELDDITGECFSEDVIERIFAGFCVGK